MPPQQSHGLLDRFDELFGFGAHQRTLLFDSARKLVRESCDVNVRRTASFGKVQYSPPVPAPTAFSTSGDRLMTSEALSPAT